MKTICGKTNPAFKRTQLLPVMLNLRPPTTGGAARQFSEFIPSAIAKDRAQRMGQQRQSEQTGLRDK